VAELVDALDSKSSSARSAGSIPARGTKLYAALPVTQRPSGPAARISQQSCRATDYDVKQPLDLKQRCALLLRRTRAKLAHFYPSHFVEG
jgi:hypothetical protein